MPLIFIKYVSKNTLMDKKQIFYTIMGERNLIPHEIKEIWYSCTRVGGAYIYGIK